VPDSVSGPSRARSVVTALPAATPAPAAARWQARLQGVGSRFRALSDTPAKARLT
jgi:hypothetical protein